MKANTRKPRRKVRHLRTCAHANSSAHPADQDIRMCKDCDMRSCDGGATWMPFKEYQDRFCVQHQVRTYQDGLIEASNLLVKWSNNLCDEGRKGTVVFYGGDTVNTVSLDDPAKLYASEMLATVAYELRRRGGRDD